MEALTVSSSLLFPVGEKHLTPAMVTALWVIGDEIDRRRIPANASDPIWLEIPSAQLRGSDGRNDNIWLRECLERLTGMKMHGEYRGDPWGAVVLAEWHIEQGGAITRLLIPPAAIKAIRVSETFAKIEAFAAYNLKGAARRLYAALADKKRMREKYWTYSLDELRHITGVHGKKSYERWNNFKFRVLDPAVKEINDFGTVTVTMKPEKIGRAVASVRFDWRWKSIDEARITEEENQQPSAARHMDRTQNDAPPLTDAQKLEERERYQNWERNNPGSTYGQYLDWKKAQNADEILRKAGFKGSITAQCRKPL